MFKLVLVFTVFPFLSENAKGKRGHVYGLGSAQYREHVPSSRVPNGLARNLELKMLVGGPEKSLKSVNQLLQTLLLQQAPTGQTSAQPQAPTTQPNPVNGKQKQVVHLVFSFVTRFIKLQVFWQSLLRLFNYVFLYSLLRLFKTLLPYIIIYVLVMLNLLLYIYMKLCFH